MGDGQGKGRGRGDEKLDYVEPVLVGLDEKHKFELGMCGVGVTGIGCGSGSVTAAGCGVGGVPA